MTHSLYPTTLNNHVTQNNWLTFTVDYVNIVSKIILLWQKLMAMLSPTVGVLLVLQVHKHEIIKVTDLYSRFESTLYYIFNSSPLKIDVPFIFLFLQQVLFHSHNYMVEYVIVYQVHLKFCLIWCNILKQWGPIARYLSSPFLIYEYEEDYLVKIGLQDHSTSLMPS